MMFGLDVDVGLLEGRCNCTSGNEEGLGLPSSFMCVCVTLRPKEFFSDGYTCSMQGDQASSD